MKIAIAQLNYKIGDFAGNARKITECIERAQKDGADLVVFSELSVTGSYPYDLLQQTGFVGKAEKTVAQIAGFCTGIAAVIGAPRLKTEACGKRIFNSAYFLADGKVVSIQDKVLLSDKDVFDESRHFAPGRGVQPIEYKGKRFVIIVGDELTASEKQNENKKCSNTTVQELSELKPDFILNISAVPFAWNLEEERRNKLCAFSEKYRIPVLQVNQVGAQGELIFAGSSVFIRKEGEVSEELNGFAEDFRMVDTIHPEKPLIPQKTERIEKIHDALVLGIRDYFQKSGLKKAVIGLSGGIDSAVTLVLAAEALGTENMWVVLLPSAISPGHSVDDARKLAENLGVSYTVLTIQDVVDSFTEKLSPLFQGKKPDVTEENIQARVRGTLLMALSNKFGHILLNTSNKSESAVGYGTLYGDMSGGLAVLADVYKTDVYNLARFMNCKDEIIPENTILKPPSAELRPDQKDTDSLPEYAVLDEILFSFIEENLSLCEIIDKGFDAEVVKKVIRMVKSGEFKRFQAAPVLRVSSRAFGPGRKMPLVAAFSANCTDK